MDEVKKRPGTAVSEFNRYEVRVNQESKEREVVGVKDPSGKFHSLGKNEVFMGLINDQGVRKPFVEVTTGEEVKTVPFKEWVASESDKSA